MSCKTVSTKAYKKNTDKEKLYIWAADNFNRQIRQHYPTLSPMCLVAKNEFGVKYGFFDLNLFQFDF